MHGGKGSGRPITVGRYSVKHRASLAAKAEQFDTAAFGDLTAELVLLRVLLQEYIERFPDGVKLTGADVNTMRDLVEAIGRMEERRVKVKNDSAFGVSELQYLTTVFGDLINEFVPDGRRADALAYLQQRLHSRT